MLFGLKAMLVLALNMTLVGSLLLGRVSFHGIIHMWVHCMPVLRVNKNLEDVFPSIPRSQSYYY